MMNAVVIGVGFLYLGNSSPLSPGTAKKEWKDFFLLSVEWYTKHTFGSLYGTETV